MRVEGIVNVSVYLITLLFLKINVEGVAALSSPISTPTTQAQQQQQTPTFAEVGPKIPPSVYSQSHYDSLSVIVPAHNTAPYITRTLLSIEQSVRAFKQSESGNKVTYL